MFKAFLVPGEEQDSLNMNLTTTTTKEMKKNEYVG